MSPGDSLTLVWADEFDGAQLDPATWFFEEGDGSPFILSPLFIQNADAVQGDLNQFARLEVGDVIPYQPYPIPPNDINYFIFLMEVPINVKDRFFHPFHIERIDRFYFSFFVK